MDNPPYDLFLTGRIEPEMVLQFQKVLRDTDAEIDDDSAIRINISSEGGDIELSLAIVSQIFELRRQGRKIITHCNSGAYSSGMTILQAGDIRTMDEFAMLMTHEPQITLDAWVGSMTEFDAYSAAVKRIGDKAVEILAARSGHDQAFIREHMFNGNDNYFDAGTALDYNLVDLVTYAP